MAVKHSGQITVATAGTEVQGPNLENPNGFYLVAHPDNTDVVWVGNNGDGTVSSSTGYPLSAGSAPILTLATNLNQLWFDADANTSKICWLRA